MISKSTSAVALFLALTAPLLTPLLGDSLIMTDGVRIATAAGEQEVAVRDGVFAGAEPDRHIPGATAGLRIGSLELDGAAGPYRSFVEFDPTVLPADAIVTSARLYLFRDTAAETAAAPMDLELFGILPPFDSAAATWNERAPGQRWVSGGGDPDATPLVWIRYNPADTASRVEFPSTPAVVDHFNRAIASGTPAALLIAADAATEADAASGTAVFYSSANAPEADLRPMLVIYYVTGESWETGNRFGSGADRVDDATVRDFIYVDVNTGSDTNNGDSPARAFKTIQKGLFQAAHINGLGRPVKVIVAPGEYLEGDPNMAWSSAAIGMPGFQTPAPIIIEGAGWEPGKHTGNVIISGAEVWTDWNGPDANGAYWKAWPYDDWGVNPAVWNQRPEVTRRFEAVHLKSGDGDYRVMMQVLSASDPTIGNLAEGEGHFWMDLANMAVKRIWFVPPTGVNPNAADVEVKVTARKRLLYLHHPSAGGIVPSHVVLRNLVFQHSGSRALYLQNPTNGTIEDCVFRWNKLVGAVLEGIGMDAAFTVRNSAFIANGMAGLNMAGRNSLIENIVFRDNGRQNEFSERYDWDISSWKAGDSQYMTLRNIFAEGTAAHGCWFDTNIVNVELVDSLFRDNASAGVYIENNNRNNIRNLGDRTTVVVRETIFDSNRGGKAIPAVNPGNLRIGKGFQLAESENADIRNNLAVNNQVAFQLTYNTRGPISRNVLRHNLFAVGTDENDAVFAAHLQAWKDWTNTLTSATNFNAYMDPRTAAFPDAANKPTSFAAYQEFLQTNPLNPFDHADTEAGSLHLQQAYDGRPLVTVEGVQPFIGEGTQAAPAFRIKRVTLDTAAPLTVAFDWSTRAGATDAADFAATLPTEAVIAAGDQAVVIYLDPLADGKAEGPETIGITLRPADDRFLGVAEASALVLDADQPDFNQVSVASLASISEADGAVAAFTVTRTGDLRPSLTVNYTVSGSAVAGQDYAALSGQLVFAAGEPAVTIVVTPVNDDIPEFPKELVVNLADGGDRYARVYPDRAVLVLHDDDLVVPATVATEVVHHGRPVIPLTISNVSDRAQTFHMVFDDAYLVVDNHDSDAATFAWLNTEAVHDPVTFAWVFPNDDGITAPLPLGFEFPFYGEIYDSVRAHSNGFLTFHNGTISGLLNSARTLPNDSNASAPAMIAAFWRDLGIKDGALVNRARIGDNFVVGYDGIVGFPSFGSNVKKATFQTILRRNGLITIQYAGNEIASPATVGIQNASKTEGITVAYSEAYATAGRTLHLVPPSAWIRPVQPQVTIQGGASATLEVLLDPSLMPAGNWRYSARIRSDEGLQPDVLVPISMVVRPASPLWTTAQPLGDGSLLSDWMGVVRSSDDYPGWQWSAELGWFHTDGDDPASVVLFHDHMGWLWSGRGTYPYLWSFTANNWIYVVRALAADNPRWLYSYANQRFETIP